MRLGVLQEGQHEPRSGANSQQGQARPGLPPKRNRNSGERPAPNQFREQHPVGDTRMDMQGIQKRRQETHNQ